MSHKQFRFVPSDNPKLSNSFHNITWDCSNASLTAIITETPYMEVFKWFNSLNAKYNKTMNESFLDESSAILTIFNCDDEIACKLKLTRLRLVSHKCILVNGTDPDMMETKHTIELSYHGCEATFFEARDYEKIDYSTDPNATIDQEWKAVSTAKKQIKSSN